LVASPSAQADEIAGFEVGAGSLPPELPLPATTFVSGMVACDADASAATPPHDGAERSDAAHPSATAAVTAVYDDPGQPARTSASRVSGFLAPQTPGGGDDCDPVTLYRAVEPPELDQIISDGYLYGIDEGWSEGKYFFPTSQQAADFAQMNPDREYTLTSAEFPLSVFSDPEVWVDTIGGEGEAIFLPEKYFPHGPVRIYGSIP